jgi:hypothetical protein
MENSQDKNKQEPQAQTPSLFSLGIPSSLGLSNNPLSYLGSHESKLPQDEQTKNNIFMQKRNRMDSDKMDITSEQEIKSGEGGETGNELNMKSPLQKNKLYQLNQSNNHEQFVCKKMSMDIDDDVTNSNASNKKFMGCNCKNSGCLKRYCECFSRMKYCDNNCQCKNCINNIKYEKERTEAIKLYLVKSPVSFKKINMDLNNITCNCKKSNCLKNYCECFQFGLKCTYSCGCVDCKNRNLLEKKLFFVENNCDNNSKKVPNTNISDIKININDNKNDNTIKLQEEEPNVNETHNSKGSSGGKTEAKKIVNNPQFIVNKAVNNNNLINNISSQKQKNRTRFFSFDDESQWSNLNLKRIELSNKQVIIDNYNINQPEEMGYNNQFPNNNINLPTNNINFPNYYNNLGNNNFINNNSNNNPNVITTRKNSAFSAIK